MDELVQLHEIVKNYRNHRALKGVSLGIKPGITGLLGPNGAGKSTLIKVLLGLVKVSAGSGKVLGHDIVTGGREIRSKVGFMPEDDCYIAGMSGVEVVRFAACLSGLPSVEGLRRAHEILDFCGMQQERYREIETYSTGMRQKIKFAQAIVHDPPLLIFDEPTSGLDPEEREAMLLRIRTLWEKHGKSTIISTHILPDVQAICDNVIILANGEVRLTGELEELNRPSSPALNLRIWGDAHRMAVRLKERGATVEEQDDGGLSVSAEDGDIGKLIFATAHEADVGIQSLTPTQNSLEAIFMDAVKESANADS